MDANVLLSIAMGGAAARLVNRPDFTLFTTSHSFEETHEYLPVLASRRGLNLERMERTLQAIPIQIVPSDLFANHCGEAQRRIGARDPEDIDLLALALHLSLTIWTNDRDFEVAELPTVTTAQLLAQVGRPQ